MEKKGWYPGKFIGRFKTQRFVREDSRVSVYLTCDEKRAQYILSNGITGSCDVEGTSDREFFEERGKCNFAWLSLEQARRSEFGHVIFEVCVNPEEAHVADLTIACDMFNVCTYAYDHPNLESRCIELVKAYRQSMQRLSEYLAKGNIKPEEVEVIIDKPVSIKDITFLERRPLHSF